MLLTVRRAVHVMLDGVWLALSVLTQKMAVWLFRFLNRLQFNEHSCFQTTADRLKHVGKSDVIVQCFAGQHTFNINLFFLPQPRLGQCTIQRTTAAIGTSSSRCTRRDEDAEPGISRCARSTRAFSISLARLVACLLTWVRMMKKL